MTDQEINISIEHALGWQVVLSSLQSGLEAVKYHVRRPVFSYTTDLDALAAAVAAMPDWWQDRFTIELTRECGSHKLAVNAPARKRAQVFVALCQKWPEATATKTATTPADVQKSQQS